MKPVRHLIQRVLDNGGVLPSWTLKHEEGVWTLRTSRRIVARWRERDAAGAGNALMEILETLAVVGPVALAASRTVAQQAAAGAGGGVARANAYRDDVMQRARLCVARGEEPKARAKEWAGIYGVHLATMYRWIAKGTDATP